MSEINRCWSENDHDGQRLSEVRLETPAQAGVLFQAGCEEGCGTSSKRQLATNRRGKGATPKD